MKGKMFMLALFVSVSLAGQGFAAGHRAVEPGCKPVYFQPGKSHLNPIHCAHRCQKVYLLRTAMADDIQMFASLPDHFLSKNDGTGSYRQGCTIAIGHAIPRISGYSLLN